MQYMLIRKADDKTEKGTLPSEHVYKAMLDYNERMIHAGVFVSGAGLKPTREGCRVQFRDGHPTVTQGPFTPLTDQVAGYSILDADSLEDAIEWAKQWPREDGDGNAILELRPYYQAEGLVSLPLKGQYQRQLDLPTEVNVHLSFPGSCREAMTFYQEVTGGFLETMITFAETPAAAEVPAELSDRIIHASLNIRGRRLMGADMADDCHQAMQGSCIHLEFDTHERAAHVFDQLQDGGQIIMPFAETFWARRFGMTTDRFGTHWMIGYGTGQCPQDVDSSAITHGHPQRHPQ